MAEGQAEGTGRTGVGFGNRGDEVQVKALVGFQRFGKAAKGRRFLEAFSVGKDGERLPFRGHRLAAGFFLELRQIEAGVGFFVGVAVGPERPAFPTIGNPRPVFPFRSVGGGGVSASSRGGRCGRRLRLRGGRRGITNPKNRSVLGKLDF